MLSACYSADIFVDRLLERLSSSLTDRPEKTDFVRMATMMDALIVPFAAVGMAESLTTIADGESPFLCPFSGCSKLH